MRYTHTTIDYSDMLWTELKPDDEPLAYNHHFRMVNTIEEIEAEITVGE